MKLPQPEKITAVILEDTYIALVAISLHLIDMKRWSDAMQIICAVSTIENLMDDFKKINA